jgi:hypothetical protein
MLGGAIEDGYSTTSHAGGSIADGFSNLSHSTIKVSTRFSRENPNTQWGKRS